MTWSGATAVRIIAACLGVGGLWACLAAIRAQAIVRGWPMATAQVVHRGVIRATAANLGAPAFQFTPEVRYRYVVGGRALEGNAWFPSAVHRPPRGTAAWARRQADGVPDLATVRYDPAAPEMSCLHLVPEWKLAAAAGAAGLAAIVACLV